MTDLASLVGVSTESVADLLVTLADAGLTVAAAESLTGGLLTAVLTEIPGSSSVVRGGLVVYATDLKHDLAGVDPGLLAERGPVDPLVAVALAEGARDRCAAGIGVGLTGVAGPDPQDGAPVGTWFCAVAGPGVTLTPDDVREHLRGQVASWWIPERVEIMAEIPKTATGKWSKQTLRQQFSVEAPSPAERKSDVR